jgi:hypothetical protein
MEIKMKNKKTLYALAIIFTVIAIITVVLWFTNEQKPKLTPDEIEAEKIILSYIESRNLNIEPGNKEYISFMRDLLLDGYPELTGEDPIYGDDPKLRDAIISYAGKHLDKKYKQPKGSTDPKPVPTIAVQPED